MEEEFSLRLRKLWEGHLVTLPKINKRVAIIYIVNNNSPISRAENNIELPSDPFCFPFSHPLWRSRVGFLTSRNINEKSVSAKYPYLYFQISVRSPQRRPLTKVPPLPGDPMLFPHNKRQTLEWKIEMLPATADVYLAETV